MPTILAAKAFLELGNRLPIIDVRSPGEYDKGHIPGAFNVPLFDNAERAEIGTLYTQSGREPAVLRGLEIVGPKMRSLVEQVSTILTNWQESRSPLPSRELLLHCWRGGMRSESVAWLLERVSFRPTVLQGGYKAYRQEVYATLAEPRPLLVLSGMTGSGKTLLLQSLRERGEQVIDLEGLAHHRGSAFGAIGQPPQPTEEQFENLLAREWAACRPQRRVWIEAENRLVGRIHLLDSLWDQLIHAPAIVIEVDRAWRTRYLVNLYGEGSREELTQSLHKIRKRLGNLRTEQALEALNNGDLFRAVSIALDYYDKAYRLSNLKRQPPCDHHLRLSDPTSEEAVDRLLQLANTQVDLSAPSAPEAWEQGSKGEGEKRPPLSLYPTILGAEEERDS